MNRSAHAAVLLSCHPATPCRAVHGIETEVRRAADDVLEVRYRLSGDPAGLRIPARGATGRADELWQHTCFELFCGHSVTTAYYEFNFSPSGAWAAYRFDAYRAGRAAAETASMPRIDVHLHGGGLELDACIDIRALAALRGSAVLRLGLSAVIEEADGRLSYWALAHPASRPDFHHVHAFALELPHPASRSPRGSPDG